jgi:hypothetical protein
MVFAARAIGNHSRRRSVQLLCVAGVEIGSALSGWTGIAAAQDAFQSAQSDVILALPCYQECQGSKRMSGHSVAGHNATKSTTVNERQRRIGI